VTSTIFDPVAQAICNIIDGLSLTSSLTSFKWGRIDLDSIPAGVVAMPLFRRTAVEEAESQLGADDWNISYPVLLVADLNEAVANQAQVVDMVEAFVKAIDADYSLAGTVKEAKVTEGEPYVQQDKGSRPLIGYELVVDVLKLQAT
jgi:hypothetical protein